MKQLIGMTVLGILLFGCAPKGRYYQHQDSAPKVVPKNVTNQDAIPHYEPYAPANLRAYTVRGVSYVPLSTGKGYSAKGQASWYGQKFHGHLTSNGEVYDMYRMSAAHKTLPLPSFARVTNLANGRQVVVRINDRGPFHPDRIVDLSYAAALKLDMLKTGVADVKLDVIHIDQKGVKTVGNQPIIDRPLQNQKIFIQVAASKNKNQIANIGDQLKKHYNVPYRAPFKLGAFKLQLGPVTGESKANKLLSNLKENGYPGAYKVYAD